MRYLLYCIFLSAEQAMTQSIPGVGAQPVFIVESNGLSASLSRISALDVTPDLPQILAYQKVIESFHRHHTVIPMRYGCLFEDESQVSQHLQDRGKHYTALLKELEGCVEMGIRILLPDGPHYAASLDAGVSYGKNHGRDDRAATSGSPGKANSPFHEAADHPGRAYLAARKLNYAAEERFAREMREIIEHCCAAYEGLYIKYKIESPPIRISHIAHRIPSVCLYFLVPRRSMELFCKIFHHIKFKSVKLLLSGPWPPYNFVL